MTSATFHKSMAEINAALAQETAAICALIEALEACTAPDRKLDEDVARMLGFRIAATTRGPHIIRPGGVASWELPHYTATTESRAKIIAQLGR